MVVTRTRRRRWPWMLAAVVLFGLAAWLMSRDDPERPPSALERVELPRHMRREDHQRANARRVLVPAPEQGAGEEAPVREDSARPVDPVLAALPSEVKTGVVVVEANAIRHSPVGELMVECLLSRDDGAGMQRLRDELGVDPLEAVDRIAMSDEGLVISGHFEEAKWKELFSNEGRAFGREGTIYAPRAGEDPMRVAVWRNQVVVFADDDAKAELALDRIEGRGLHGAPVIDEGMTYGEIYGVLSAQQLAELLPPDQKLIADKLRDAAEHIELHVDTTRDVGVVADVRGPSGRDTRDLGKTLGAALAVGRLKAQADGDRDLAELLDLARVVPGGEDFRLELGLPLEFLQKHLQACVDRNRERRSAMQRAREMEAPAGADAE